MSIIAIAIPLFFGILSIFQYRRITNIQFLFNCLWFFVMLFAEINFLNNIVARPEIITMSIVFEIVFNFGCIIAAMFRVRVPTIRRGINYTFVNLSVIFVYAFYIILSIRALQYLNAGGSLSGIRFEYFYGDSIIHNIWEELFITYLVDGVYKFLTFYLIYNVFHKGSKIVTVSIVGLVCLNMLFSGGRLGLLQLIFLIVVGLIQYRKKIGTKTKIGILAILTICVVAAVVISLQRNITEILLQPISYFVSPLAYSSAILNSYSIEFIGFGRFVFAPVLDFIINTLRFFGLTDTVSAAILISDITKNALVIGQDGGTFNALVPAFFHFYMEGGYLSIVIFGFLFGWIGIMAERKMYRYRGCTIELLWMYLLIGVVFSSMGWQFSHVNNATALVCFWLVGRGRKNENIMVM